MIPPGTLGLRKVIGAAEHTCGMPVFSKEKEWCVPFRKLKRNPGLQEELRPTAALSEQGEMAGPVPELR